jgi:hypothetical protein
VPGNGGAPVPQDGAGAPLDEELELLPVLAIPVELELLLPVPAIPVELELLPVPAIPVELELLPVPAMPVELELLDELELLEELELEELELEELELEELLELELLVLVELWPEFPFPLDPANIVTAIAISEGKLTPFTAPGTSRGSSNFESTNSLVPL